MPIQVSEAIDLDTGVVVTLENTTGGAYVDGKYVPGGTTITKSLASVQQPTPEQLQFLEGGERNKEMKSFYLLKRVNTGSDDQTSSVITHRGKRYKVIFVGDWEDYGYFFAIGAREQ